MIEYIEREAAKNTLRAFITECKDNNVNPAQITGLIFALNELDKTPAADVKEVVKCKECKHRYEPVNCALWYATYDGKEFFRDHGGEFSCSFGERKGAAAHGDQIPAEDRGKV